ncbi:MAG TPA: hypothetical protein VFU90_01950 [Candidatus Tumulicola sp.]|nr:hypothetical protein [Candidatus Tumulicola sp.]
MSKTVENERSTPLVTHREFKLLLKPEKFPNRRALLEFNELLQKTAAKLGVDYEPVESLDSQLRIVQFYDSKTEVLRKNKLIFRIRQIRQGGWPDESWELTFKCRAPEYEKAAAFDTDTTMTKLQKKKFKEELIRGEAPGTMVSIFSNNVIVEYPEINPEFPISRLAEALPHLKTLDLDMNEPLSIVAGAKVFEIQSTLGTLSFGHGVSASATLAVWARPVPDRFEPLIVEFGFSTHVRGKDKEHLGQDAADEFFKALQVPLREYLADGTTKTALIYGDEGA